MTELFRLVTFEEEQSNEEQLSNLESGIKDSQKILIATASGKFPCCGGPWGNYETAREIQRHLQKSDIRLFYLNTCNFQGFTTLDLLNLNITNKSDNQIYILRIRGVDIGNEFYESLKTAKTPQEIQNAVQEAIKESFPRDESYGSFLEEIERCGRIFKELK